MLKLNMHWNSERHPYHLIESSPWPFAVAFSTFQSFFSVLLFFNSVKYSSIAAHLSIIILLIVISFWFQDMLKESKLFHTPNVATGLRLGMVLFMISEICFFFSFFFAFFYVSLMPNSALGCIWPPTETSPMEASGLPLVNTAMLLMSGSFLTMSHRYLLQNRYHSAYLWLNHTVMCGLIFTLMQGIEYMKAPFTMATNVYGSLFFLCTGFHGFHVLLVFWYFG